MHITCLCYTFHHNTVSALNANTKLWENDRSRALERWIPRSVAFDKAMRLLSTLGRTVSEQSQRSAPAGHDKPTCGGSCEVVRPGNMSIKRTRLIVSPLLAAAAAATHSLWPFGIEFIHVCQQCDWVFSSIPPEPHSLSPIDTRRIGPSGVDLSPPYRTDRGRDGKLPSGLEDTQCEHM